MIPNHYLKVKVQLIQDVLNRSSLAASSLSVCLLYRAIHTAQCYLKTLSLCGLRFKM